MTDPIMESILQRVTEQNLSEKCYAETPAAQSVLEKHTKPEFIQKRITFANTNQAFKFLSFYYIEYNQEEDEFTFNKKTFNKENGEITQVDTPPCTAKWIRTIGSEYVLMYNAGDTIGNRLKYDLPVIYRKK